jgi:hypothetical protein
MMVLRRAGVVLVIVVLALGLGGAVASAKKKHKRKGQVWASKITLEHPSATQFTGRVSSGLAACSQARLVNLFFTDPSGNSTLLSVQRTDGKGRYQVDLTQSAYLGTYQAQAAQERTRARKAPQTCKVAASNGFNI